TALIDVDGGNLEIVGGRLTLAESAAVSRLIQVRGRELLLHRCHLQGSAEGATRASRDQESDKSACLIEFDTAGNAKESALLGCKDCDFVSTGPLLSLVGTRAQARLRNCLFLTQESALTLNPGATSKPDLSIWLENSTFAFRTSCLDLRWAPESAEGW